MAETKENNKVLNQIIKDFESSDDNIVLKALNKVRDKGKTSVLQPLFSLFESNSTEKIRAEIKSILADLKDSYALDIIVEKLSSGSLELNEVLLFALWNSSLNAVDFIPEIVEAAKDGNYMVALEALTVIENLDGPFSNEKLTEAQFILNEYFEEQMDDKEGIMRSILEVILKFEDTAF